MANPDTSSVQTSRSPGTARLSFTDGDTFKRFTITDANVTTLGPRPICSVVRDYVADVDDYGWSFTVTPIAPTANGSFDVTVTAQAWDRPALAGEYPNETVTLFYHLIS